MIEEKNNYIGYDYRNVTVKGKMENMYVDGYMSFGWIIPYLLYCKIRSKKSAQIEPLVNEKHDEIYNVCEKAYTLIK